MGTVVYPKEGEVGKKVGEACYDGGDSAVVFSKSGGVAHEGV